MNDSTQLLDFVRHTATDLGFNDCRIAHAVRANHADDFLHWIDYGMHGDMAWMARDPHRRCDPREVLPGCQSVICLGINYFPGHAETSPNWRIARYAWNQDYHEILWEKLRAFDELLKTKGGIQRYYVDTGPILERDFASASGLGWNGKSTVQIHRRFGTWLFLAEILTTLQLPADAPAVDHCGKCTRCIDSCPTNAITAPHQVDARRCISYLTIENKGEIPLEFRRAIGDRIYGCDECLEVCPWNKFAVTSSEAKFHANENVFSMQLRDFLSLDDQTFRDLFRNSPIKRIKRHRYLRNVCVALGNTGTQDDLPALSIAATDPDPLIATHAIWAIEEIKQRANKYLL